MPYLLHASPHERADTRYRTCRAAREYSALAAGPNNLAAAGDYMAAKDRLKKSLDSINEVLREVQRLQPSTPPLHPRVRNQLQNTTRKLKDAASEIETVMRELDSGPADAAVPC